MARESRKGAVSPAVVILILLIGGVGSIGTMWWNGDLRIPGLDEIREDAEAEEVDKTGKVAVPLAARRIPAYTQVRRDDFWNPELSEFMSVMLDAEDVEERGIMTATQILGRVLAVDKKQGYVFSEEDFLPPGTREGPTAGIEPGMRGLRVPADKIQGLHGLRRGDRFDLVATQKLDTKREKKKGGDVTPLAKAQQAENDAWEASTRIIVQNGKIIEPVRNRQFVASNGTQMKSIEEVFVGVAESEVTQLTEALAVSAEILCVPRSAIPGAGDGVLETHPGPETPGLVEIYSDGQRRLTYVPRGPTYESNELDEAWIEEELADEGLVSTRPEQAPVVSEVTTSIADESSTTQVEEATAPVSTQVNVSEAAQPGASNVDDASEDAAPATTAEADASDAQDATAFAPSEEVRDDEGSRSNDEKPVEEEAETDSGYRAPRPSTPPEVLPKVKIPRVGDGKFGGKPAGESGSVD